MSPRHLLIGTIAVFLFAFIFWPGLYRYDSLSGVPVRTNRVTGTVQILAGTDWITTSSSSNGPLSGPEELPQDSLGRISGTASFTLSGYFNVELYNGTGWTLSEVEFSIEPAGRDTSNPFSRLRREWPRLYRRSVAIPPLTAVTDAFLMAANVGRSQPSWSVTRAWGKR